MDLFTVIRERRSCRSYLPDPIDEETINRVLESAIWAPSPVNDQPWEFIVITDKDLKEKIFFEAEERKKLLFERSGWKWLNKYDVGFLRDVPVIVAVVGDPKKSGGDMFLEKGGLGYQHACSAAIQNILLTAHALGLGSLWFTLFEPDIMRKLLGVDSEKVPLALICLGKPGCEPFQTPRNTVEQKTSHL